MYLIQSSWTSTTGLGLGRIIDTTSSPEAKITETTGGPLAAATLIPAVSPEEHEWALLSKSERKRAVRKRVTGQSINKAVRAVRYGQ